LYLVDSEEWEESTKTSTHSSLNPSQTFEESKTQSKIENSTKKNTIEDSGMVEEWVAKDPKLALKNKLAPKTKVGRQLAARRKAEKSIFSNKKQVKENLTQKQNNISKNFQENSEKEPQNLKSSDVQNKISKEKMKGKLY